MTTAEAIQLLEKFRARGVGRDQVVRAFQDPPVADLGFAQVDTHRALRKGFPEVIFGSGKTPAQVVSIASKLVDHEQRVLATRATPEHVRVLKKKFRHAVHHELARCVTIQKKPLPKRAGTIAVVCATRWYAARPGWSILVCPAAAGPISRSVSNSLRLLDLVGQGFKLRSKVL